MHAGFTPDVQHPQTLPQAPLNVLGPSSHWNAWCPQGDAALTSQRMTHARFEPNLVGKFADRPEFVTP